MIVAALRPRLSGWRAQLPLVWLLTRQELIDRHKGSVLGKTWTLIAPLINILVFVLVFSRIMGARLEGFGAEIDQYTYSIYLICGILAWTAFAKSLNTVTNLYGERAHLITKVKVSLKALPISILLAESIIYVIGMVFFAVFLVLIDFPFSAWWLGVPLVFALQVAFTYSLGLLLAVLAVYLKDIKEAVSVLLPVWFWTTPIVYVSDILPAWVMGYMRFNPLFQLVDAYRDLIMYQRLPGLGGLAGVALAAILLLAAALWVLKRTERDLRDCLRHPCRVRLRRIRHTATAVGRVHGRLSCRRGKCQRTWQIDRSRQPPDWDKEFSMITVNDLHKSFKLFARPGDRLIEAITGRHRHSTHVALDGVSFSVGKGEVLGVLGRNGAGKSTLLKLMTGVLLPDAGEIHINGRVTGLLELGTGFNPELTGADNITANALMLGMTHAEIKARYQAIIDFSELGEYINEPLRTYSSGMVMRLGFSVAIHADPACLLVDEALSVGDGYFQQKCMKRIREFKDQGGAILFVSHDLNAVKVLCDSAIVLEGGRIVHQGDPEGAVNLYNRIMARQAEEEEGRHQQRAGAYGTGQAVVSACRALGRHSQGSMLSSGETLDIHMKIEAREALDDVAIGIMIRDRFGQDIFGINTYQRQGPFSLATGEQRDVHLAIEAAIAPGKYTLTLALHSGDHHLDDCYWWHDSALQFEVAGYRGPKFSGICRLPCEIDLNAAPIALEDSL